MEAIMEALNALYEWFASGLYDFVVEFWSWVAIKAVTWWYEALLWKLTFAWDIASEVVSDLSMAGEISAAISALPGQAEDWVRYARVPEALNLIGTAGVTKIVLRFIP